MTVYTYSRIPALNPNTSPMSVAKSASGSVYDINDTGFLTPLNMTLVATNAVVTTISSDANGIFPDFTLLDRTSCVFKAATGLPFVLTTTTPVPGPPGGAGPAGAQGPAGVADDASVKNLVTTPGSQTAAALSATFVPKWKPNTAYLAGDAVLSPAGDTVTAVANFTSGASFNAANWNLSPTYVPFVDPAPGVMGIRKKVSATYGTGWVFGNAASFGFSGTGTPAEIAGAFGIYQEYGKATPGAPVLKTTQAGYSIANYWGPTTDDSAEGFSSAAILKTTAGTPFTQAKPLTAFEAIAQVETGNSVSGAGSYALGVGSRLNILGTGNVDTGYGFKASVNTSGGPPYGTLGTYYAFVQLTPSGATNAYGVYVADKINSETALSIGKSAFSGSLSAKLTGNGDSSNSLLLINLPTAADAPGTLTGIRVVAPTGQTKPLQEWFGAGSGTAGSRIDSGGNFSARTSINLTDSTFASNLMRLDSSGLTLTTGMNLILSTALGTKFGTATSQKLAFYGATPVIQQARPTDAASIIALLTTLGLCA